MVREAPGSKFPRRRARWTSDDCGWHAAASGLKPLHCRAPAAVLGDNFAAKEYLSAKV